MLMVTIRYYKKEDREVLRDLVLQLHESVRLYDTDLLPGDEIIERYFNELMKQTEETDGAAFVAEENDQAVGYVCVYGFHDPDDSDEIPDAYSFMSELYVRSDYQNRGVGHLLVERAEQYARGLGTYKMELKVFARNESAIRFYERHGYIPRVIVMSKRM